MSDEKRYLPDTSLTDEITRLCREKADLNIRCNQLAEDWNKESLALGMRIEALESALHQLIVTSEAERAEREEHFKNRKGNAEHWKTARFAHGHAIAEAKATLGEMDPTTSRRSVRCR